MRLWEPDLDLLSRGDIAHGKGVVERKVTALLSQSRQRHQQDKEKQESFAHARGSSLLTDGMEKNDRTGPSGGSYRQVKPQ
jgi:hypothetical protein